MIKYLPKALSLFFVCLTSVVAAQQKEQPVRFANGNFITGNTISNHTFKKEAIASAMFGDSYFVLVQFDVLPSKQVQEELKKQAVFLYQYLPGNAYLAVIKNTFNFFLAKNYQIVSINMIPSFYKIDKLIADYTTTSDKQATQLMAIDCFPFEDKKMIGEALQKAGAVIQQTKVDAGNTIYIQANKLLADKIAALPFVTYVSLEIIKDRKLNYNTIGAHGISALQSLNGKNLNGKGVAVGIGDNADISSHIDFSGRLINRSAWLVDDHGTHTAGTTAGAGIINVRNHGMAPKATIINQYFSDIITNAPTYITDYNMVLTNNSYYSAAASCPGSGNYNSLSRYIDRQIAVNNELLHVVAAGNDGTEICSPLPASYGTVKTGWQAGKNVLTVGAINLADYSIAYFSSRGPMKDGRIKPEIVCNGWNVISTFSNNTYAPDFGTSMATPGVTGALALLYERYRQINEGDNPKSALVKALACNTAEDLGRAGPDYVNGFGMLNARRAVEAIDSTRYFISTVANGGNANYTINIPANTRKVKVMLYWADSAAATNAAVSLVNDLDLTVTEPSSLLHLPLILNPSSPTDVAAEGADHVNNIEQVTIENPAAGNYTIRVNGFAVPFGPQQYVVTYEIIKQAVTVEYPFGGETLVPGETENIRWSGYGSESNTFTVEYSANNGINWTTINNAVPAASRTIPWTVPTTVTDSALIRVTRNGSPFTGQSKFNFSVIGQPVVTATNACEGAVQLNWGAISGAFSYNILQLVNDSMKVVGNTGSNNFLLKGLDENTTYWVGVAAVGKSKQGRRSLSVNVVPNSGACTLSAFNNDVKVDSILEPTTARQQFANAGNAIKPVKIAIKNTGAIATSGAFNVSYTYGASIVTETVNTTIPAGGSYIYTFTGTYPIISTGFRYDFKAWVTKATDGNHLNDTAYKTVKYINNDAVANLPLSEGFEQMPAAQFTKAEMAIGENKYLDFSASSAKGRARTFVNTGIALSGDRALTLDQTPYTAISNADSVVLNYNLQNFASKQLRFDFYYKNHGQPDSAGNKVWIRGSENNAWIQAYDLYANQAELGDWKKGVVNVNDLFANAVPAQTVTKTFQIKLGQEANTSANDPEPQVDIDDGYTFDNLTLNEARNDVAVTAINSPDKGGCALTANNAVSVRIKNYNNATLNDLLVSYQVNGGAIVTEPIASIAPNQVLDYTFSQTANLAAYIDYSVNVWVKYEDDSYAANDSILNYTLHNSPVISSFPYLESFENNNGNYYTTGKGSSWQWGTPAKTIINKAPNGTKAWVTNLTGGYNDNETSYLISPCFNLNGLSQPVLSFSHIYDVELDYDYTWVEYSTDGVNWKKLGKYDAVTNWSNGGTNWYNNADADNWKGTNGKWHVASYDIPVTETNIRFRFVLSSDGGVTQEGIGIDDIRVHNKVNPVEGPFINLPASISGNWSTNNWVPLTIGDPVMGPYFIYGEINSHGQDLGTVTLNTYLNTDSIRSSNDEYYLDRNFALSSTKAPTGNVGVRLYFKDTEANTLLTATACSTCTLPKDAYEFGITQYSGSPAEHNSLLEDDLFGTFRFITADSVQIVPHATGYYAEFSTNNFSEFWLSKALIKTTTVSLCQGDTIIYKATAGASTYQWQVDNGSGFVNVTNGANYAGSTTDTLRLINLPTSNTGYQYRCIRDGVYGSAHTLRFTNVWRGTVSNNWFTAGNWSCGAVPDQYTDVIVPGRRSNYPLINANTSVRSIRVQPSAPVTLSPGVILDIKGK